jgi:hypothetical protein
MPEDRLFEVTLCRPAFLWRLRGKRLRCRIDNDLLGKKTVKRSIWPCIHSGTSDMFMVD